MTKQNYTHITFVLDRSGSMVSCKEAAQDSLNEYIQKQRTVPGDCTFSLIKFDDQYEVAHDFVKLANVPDIQLEPRGMTRLLDAMGKAIKVTGESLASKAEDERPSQILFVILTDGMENDSREYNRKQVLEMVTEQTDMWKWQFVYLGANQDAIAEAGKLGIAAGSTMTYDHTQQGYKNVGTVLTSATMAFRSSGQSVTDKFFSDEDRKKAEVAPPKAK